MEFHNFNVLSSLFNHCSNTCLPYSLAFNKLNLNSNNFNYRINKICKFDLQFTSEYPYLIISFMIVIPGIIIKTNVQNYEIQQQVYNIIYIISLINLFNLVLNQIRVLLQRYDRILHIVFSISMKSCFSKMKLVHTNSIFVCKYKRNDIKSYKFITFPIDKFF